MQNHPQQRRIEPTRQLLAHNIAVIGDDKRFAAPERQLRQLGRRVGRVQVDEVRARRLTPQLSEKGQADRRGQNVGLPSGLGHRHAIYGLAQSARPVVRDEHARVNALCPQPLRQQADMVFDPAENRVVVLVQQERFHRAIRWRAGGGQSIAAARSPLLRRPAQ